MIENDPPRIDLTVYVDDYQEFVCEAITDPAVLQSLKPPPEVGGAPTPVPTPAEPNATHPESRPST
jgi:hypothetical protein